VSAAWLFEPRCTGVVTYRVSVSAPGRTVTMLAPIRRILAKLFDYQAGTTVYAGILQGSKGSQGGTSATESPHGDTRTGLTEPCGALPRKCLFIYDVVTKDLRGTELDFDWAELGTQGTGLGYGHARGLRCSQPPVGGLTKCKGNVCPVGHPARRGLPK
jgi:hypothetical protein